MKKKLLVGVVGLAAVALVGGTFAYFNQSTIIDNPFDTGKYSSIAVEEFNPEEGENWEAGVTVAKKVSASNTGDQPVVVRVSFKDIWSRNEKNDDGTDKVDDDGKVITTTDGLPKLDTKTSMKYGQDDAKDGFTEKDFSVVTKNFAEGAKPGAPGSKWSGLIGDDTNGYYYYYLENLAPQTSTGTFLESVTLASDLDMGKYTARFYYAIRESGLTPTEPLEDNGNPWTLVKDADATFDEAKNGAKVTAFSVDSLLEAFEASEYETKRAALIEKLIYNSEDNTYAVPKGETIYTSSEIVCEDGQLGYSDANYLLEITIESVQATDEAVLSTFFQGKPYEDLTNEEKEVYDSWSLRSEDL